MSEGKKILLLEDEKAIANALSHKLENEGFVVTVKYNGVEGLEELENNSYDLVVADLLMPEADGWTVLTKLQGSNQKIIITSNLSQEEDIQKAKELGAIDFLVKSEVSLSEIVDRIKLVLN